MIWLRLVWILGFVSTETYAIRVRTTRFGTSYPGSEIPTCAVRSLETMLNMERISLILFLLGTVALTYAVLHDPVLS